MAATKRSDQDKPVRVSEIIPHIESMLSGLREVKDNYCSCTFSFENDLKEIQDDDIPVSLLKVSLLKLMGNRITLKIEIFEDKAK
jgi:hypothetical protein